MPASEVMSLYRQHKLHSGPGGPVVKKKKQAVAIQISMARKEGHHIPKPDDEVKGSFQQGGLVPETGKYLLHGGERVHPGFAQAARRSVQSRDIEDRRQDPNLSRIGSIMGADEITQRAAQARDIAARTNQAQHDEWNRAMRAKEDWGGAMARGRAGDALGTPPQPRDIPPAGNDPHYAIAGLQGNVAQRMHEQGEAAAGLVPGGGYSSVRPAQPSRLLGSFDQGGDVKQTGDYQVHQGEQLVPGPGFYRGATEQNFTYPIRDTESELGTGPGFYKGATSQNFTYPIRDTDVGPAPDISGAAGAKKKSFGYKAGTQDNPQLQAMQSNVNAPLHRVEGFKHGGKIPRTGIYRLHAGEHVIPKSLAGRYREMKEHA